MSFFNLFQSYDEVVNAIIQPPKQDYHLHDLGNILPFSTSTLSFNTSNTDSSPFIGPKEMCIRKKLFRRTDLRLTNRRGYSIECSYFDTHDQQGPVPCIIYLHANGCSRLEAIQYMETIGMNGMSLFCFDFSGSGKSEGPVCSLGWFEQDDLVCAIDHLFKTGKVSSIAVWGRSMGAITALLYANKDPRISCLVLDSPFVSFKQFAKDFAKKRANIPGVVTLAALAILGSSVKTRANFDLDKIDPLSQVPSTKIPAIFAAAQDDSFIPPSHSQELYENYGGSEKKLIFFEGDHNTSRPLTFLCKVMAFLREHLIDAKNLTTAGITCETTNNETDKPYSNIQLNIPHNTHRYREEEPTEIKAAVVERQDSSEQQQTQQTDVSFTDVLKIQKIPVESSGMAATGNQHKEFHTERVFNSAEGTIIKQVASNTDREVSVERKSVNARGSKLVFSWLSSEHSTSTPNLHGFSSQKESSKGEGGHSALMAEPDAEIGAENTANNPNCTPIKQRKIDRSVTSVSTSMTMNRTSSAINLQQNTKEGYRPPRAGLPPSKINVRGLSYDRSIGLQQPPSSIKKIEANFANSSSENPTRSGEDQLPLKGNDENATNQVQPQIQGELQKNPMKPTAKIIGLAKSTLPPKSTKIALVQADAKEASKDISKESTKPQNPKTPKLLVLRDFQVRSKDTPFKMSTYPPTSLTSKDLNNSSCTKAAAL